MIKAALFDMDGTICHTIEYWTQIIPNYVRAKGFEMPEEEMVDIHGMSMEDIAGLIIERYNLEESPRDIVEAWRVEADRVYTELAPLRDGAEAFLRRLHEMGITLMLVTNNDRALAEALLKRTGIRDLFTDLYCGYNLGLGKTEPTMIELARKACGTTPEETWMFEDSLAPVRTAKGVGIRTVAMLDPFHGEQENALLRQNADVVCDTYDDANRWLDELVANWEKTPVTSEEEVKPHAKPQGLTIRHGHMADIEEIMRIYAAARTFMAENGNPNQWGTHFPPQDLIEDYIQKGELYVVEEDGVIHGAFAFFIGEDPLYAVITEGEWASDTTYGAIHRVASDGQIKGMVSEMFNFCENHISHLRIDTHEDNSVMRYLIKKHNFKRRGMVKAVDGTPRIAYERL